MSQTFAQNKTVENTEFSEAQKLEAFKKEIWREIDYEELWEKQQLENKQQQEILDRKYYNDLIRKRKLYQKQAIASRFEKGTLVTKA